MAQSLNWTPFYTSTHLLEYRLALGLLLRRLRRGSTAVRPRRSHREPIWYFGRRHVRPVFVFARVDEMRRCVIARTEGRSSNLSFEGDTCDAMPGQGKVHRSLHGGRRGHSRRDVPWHHPTHSVRHIDKPPALLPPLRLLFALFVEPSFLIRPGLR